MYISRRAKQVIIFVNDLIISLFASWLAVFLRLGSIYLPNSFYWHENITLGILIAAILFIPIFIFFKIYLSVLRFSGFKYLSRILFAGFIYGSFFLIIILSVKLDGIPRSMGVTQPIIFILLVILSRIVAVQLIETYNASKNIKKVIIYGAGKTGAEVSKSLVGHSQYRLVAFIDKDIKKKGKNINNVYIYGAEDLEKIINKNKATDILIALPNIGLFARRELIRELKRYNLNVMTIPSIDSLVEGKISINDFKDLDLNEIIERDIKLDLGSLKATIESKIILITGAGGSIGSELTRQIITNNPKKIILIDHSEFNLYSILEDLKNLFSDHNTDIISILISIQNTNEMERVFSKYKPDIVFHAAAYKHVPLIEENIFEGIKNNIFSTLNILKIFDKYNGKKFILVSTDKAVRPKNIMGATKRVAELIVQAYANKKNYNKNFSIVRFGNVLNSSGSVVPLFRKQINDGGPLTITHPDITRYFMTIPEAVGLILQCSVLAKNGELFILDMGKPVKIVDIARRMMKLSGLIEKNEQNPQGDIEIKFTGLRPGEKLYEELLIADKSYKTNHRDILIAEENHMSFDELEIFLSSIMEAVNNNDINEIKKMLSFSKFINYNAD